jgi:ABC-type phosphate/phosphonate transport system substrate-binding protein
MFCAVSLATLFPPSAPAQETGVPIQFIGVTPDDDYEAADKALEDYLQKAGRERFEARLRPSDYHAAIQAVVERKAESGPYVARLTPYAYVVAEIQGAKFETLATYLSQSTQALTYHAYFVVNTRHPGFRFSDQPDLAEVHEFLSSGVRSFVFHDKFSTSSYFVPLNYFRAHRVFDTEKGQRTGRFTPISVRQAGTGSSDLVRMVLAGQADLAAVWDGTKKKFEGDPQFASLRFVRLDAPLPNDLLVCSSSLEPERREKLRAAVSRMTQGSPELAGDFLSWVNLSDASDAREALASLRRGALAQPAPVTVQITWASKGSQATDSHYAPFLQAAQQAVRLAGTEFVLFDPDFHRWADVDWKLEIIHDGAIKLTSTVNGNLAAAGARAVEPQVFRISFADVEEDLTRRIEAIILTRLHRIRYVWPFENKVPTVLRDVAFSLPPGTPVAVQKITWTDPDRNEFTAGDAFTARVTQADFFKFQLSPESFPKLLTQELDLNPMSNSAYRVVLVRPVSERPIFRYLTVALVVLLVCAAVAAALDYRRLRSARADQSR